MIFSKKEAKLFSLQMLGGEARLPCELTPSQPGDSVYLVLWYKKQDKTPIYRCYIELDSVN